MKYGILYKMLFIAETLKYEVLSEEDIVMCTLQKKFKERSTQK